jgi:predicted alpha/beta-hydrolase family hydrolase
MTDKSHAPSRLTITVDGTDTVSGLLLLPDGAKASLVLAHGAGAGMSHPFMAAVAMGLAERGVATLRYQFSYMERGSRRPDGPRVAHATVRAAVDAAHRHVVGLPLFAGGKSFGGRMTSQAQAASALSGVQGLIFLGFPLHPADKPSDDRAQHLSDVRIPMLFLQGTRDTLADPVLVENVARRLGQRATLRMFAEADHSFHVQTRSGLTDAEVRGAILDAAADWITTILRTDRQDG